MRLASLCLALMLLAGCAARADQQPVAHHSRSSLAWGMANLGDLPTLDPALASDPASITVASMVYGGLVRLDPRSRVVPDGADRWTIGNAGTLYTFHVRHGLRFADGRFVTASDFAHALHRALDSVGSAGPAPAYLGLIASSARVGKGPPHPGILATSADTLQIRLNHPAAHFLAELAFPASYVADPSVEQQYGGTWTDHASGFGPYYVREWQHGRYLVLARNPYYYGGLPHLKTVTIRFYSNDDSSFRAFSSGAVSLVSNLAPGAAVPGRLSQVRRVPALAMDYLAFNTRRLPFHRLDARRAFADVWSTRLGAATIASAGFSLKGFLPSSFGIDTRAPHTRASAAAYLARAHYPDGQNFPVITMVLPRDPVADRIARALQTGWSRVLNVNINLRQLNPSTYSDVLNNHDFDLALIRWGGDYPDPQDFLGTQLGSSSDNVTGWSGKAFDRDVALADSYAPTDPRRAGLFRQAAEIAQRKVPIVPLDEPSIAAVIAPGVRGLTPTALGTVAGEWTRVAVS